MISENAIEGATMTDDTILVEPLWEGALEAFNTMIMLPLERIDEYKDGSTGLVGSITFMGALQGALVMQCSMESATKIAKSMLMMGDDDPMSHEEVEDALGEVVNLVLGGFKSRIAEDLGEIQISVPMVMEGREVIPAVGTEGKKVSVAAVSDGCQLNITVVYKES